MDVMISGDEIDTIQFPFTGESVSFGMRFNIRGFAGMDLKSPRWEADPISLNFILQVGLPSDNPAIKDTEDLINKCEQLAKASLPKRKQPIKGAVKLTIGNWFYAQGFISNLNFEFGKPWDNGKPMSANLTLEFKPLTWVHDTDKDIWRRMYRDEFNTFTNWPKV